ncbi:FKBP-type peptidyl-prolyl cis-trans isomerase [Carboxylicivirga caseinilyticus]|uniref:FKBP-type peptidyl-prolyl cis-trans isomerase n=1 Tax=Carboxylicivirga caseinilyticus TaxID=3417572 RepID=UPI003D34681F|nr:FKBP-type peptidyl-prolyl cis-trans isomerase [Marinilabiliaceae bacterium A049]
MKKLGLIKRLLGVFLLAITAVSCIKENDVTETYDALKQLEIDEALIADYIADNGIDATEIIYNGTASGVYYYNHEIADESDTEKPNSTSEVTVAYKGYLLDGTVFDSTDEGESISFILSGLIVGWQIGIPVMSKGDKLTLIIPSPYGYGPYAAGAIPANSVLIFDIELIDFTN